MTGLIIREARPDDLAAIIGMHEGDAVGGHGDGWSEATRPAYEAAFRAIATGDATMVYVAEADGAIVGTFQLTVTWGLTSRGALRARLESVQVRADLRSRGIGAAMVAFAEAEARSRGAVSLQLMSNKHRTEAHRFYQRLGYARSHEGFTKPL